MKIAKAFLAASLTAVLAASAHAQVRGFSDDFEAATLNPFWTLSATAGWVTFPDTSNPHTGHQSVRLDSVFLNPGPNKNIYLEHVFPQPTYGAVSVWIFDQGAGSQSSNYIGLRAGDLSVYTFDYDLGPTNGGSYAFDIVGRGGFQSIALRSNGWHEFRITSLASGVTLQVDGIVIYSGPGGYRLPAVRLFMGGPNWRPSWTTWFDDFAFSPEASYVLYGTGCAGAAGIPTIQTPITPPRPGTTFAITIAPVPAGSAALGALGFSDQLFNGTIALPFSLGFIGMPGCWLLTSSEVTESLTTHPTPTSVSWSIPLPNVQSLLGVDFYQQAVVTDPTANALGVITSNAGHGRIGI
ncbi:MAG: hypothetical protein IPM29_07605 [Planctomycetes bacterium]|nr:hypothetical protein [Planctomycetota bacterium]